MEDGRRTAVRRGGCDPARARGGRMIAPDVCAAAGRVIELLGPVARARLSSAMALGEIGFVGDDRLFAEVVGVEGDVATLQVYESTVGLAAGAPVYACGHPLVAELGPGL